MSNPTTRLLTILELLQSHPTLSGEELARRLEVEPRTVRRYILMLQDMGMPIEAVRGPGGGYGLRPGFKLPPLMFSEEEGLAIMFGLLASAWLEIDQSALAIEGALAKVSRVLPARARERLQAVSAHLVLFRHSPQARLAASLLIDLSTAIHASQRIAMRYRSLQQEITQRKVEPYGISGWQGRWYLAGYCCLRRDYRLFRLDRVEKLEVLVETFTKAGDFNYQAFVREKGNMGGIRMEVEFQADLETVRQSIPELYGTLTATPAGVLLQEQYDNIEGMARYLMAIDLPFIVRNPPELRDALRRLGERMIRLASVQPNA